MAKLPSFIDELADWLATQNIGSDGSNLAVGSNIFVDGYPPEPDDLVAVLSSAPTTGEAALYISDMSFPGVQIMVRTADYSDGESIGRRICEACNAKIGLKLPHFRVLRMHVYSGCQFLSEDDTGRSEFSININAQARPE